MKFKDFKNPFDKELEGRMRQIGGVELAADLRATHWNELFFSSSIHPPFWRGEHGVWTEVREIEACVSLISSRRPEWDRSHEECLFLCLSCMTKSSSPELLDFAFLAQPPPRRP